MAIPIARAAEQLERLIQNSSVSRVMKVVVEVLIGEELDPAGDRFIQIVR